MHSRSGMTSIQQQIGRWGDETFDRSDTDAVIKGCIAHMIDEVHELAEAWYDKNPVGVREEVADIMILSFQIAHVLGFDALNAVRAKHIINETRTWAKADARGVSRHIEDGEDETV